MYNTTYIFSKLAGFLDFPNFQDLDKWFGIGNVKIPKSFSYATEKIPFSICGKGGEWRVEEAMISHGPHLPLPDGPFEITASKYSIYVC